MSKKFYVGIQVVPPNTIVGFKSEGTKNEPPSALSPKDIGSILNSSPMVNETASFTFSANTHDSQVVRVSSAANTTITLPANGTSGNIITVLQANTGRITFVAGSGATVNQLSNTFTTSGKWAMASAFVESNGNGNTASWVISGSVS